MNSKAKSTMASCFGLEVKAIIRMKGSSLIPYRGRRFVVETADLRSPELPVWDTWRDPSRSSLRALALAS